MNLESYSDLIYNYIPISERNMSAALAFKEVELSVQDFINRTNPGEIISNESYCPLSYGWKVTSGSGQCGKDKNLHYNYKIENDDLDGCIYLLTSKFSYTFVFDICGTNKQIVENFVSDFSIKGGRLHKSYPFYQMR